MVLAAPVIGVPLASATAAVGLHLPPCRTPASEAFGPRQPPQGTRRSGRRSSDHERPGPVVSVAVLIASAVVDAEDFGSQDAFFLVTLLTIGYMVSRGLAKSGSRDYYDDEVSRDARESRSNH